MAVHIWKRVAGEVETEGSLGSWPACQAGEFGFREGPCPKNKRANKYIQWEVTEEAPDGDPGSVSGVNQNFCLWPAD